MAHYLNKTQLITKGSKGFTLIEIMITIAIIGIIAAAAWPSYERYQQKSRRADGISALLQNSANLEKCFINNSTYVGCTLLTESKRKYYNVENTLAAETYSLTATPKGAQAGDAECASLTVNELSEKESTGSAPTKRCWSQ